MDENGRLHVRIERLLALSGSFATIEALENDAIQAAQVNHSA